MKNVSETIMDLDPELYVRAVARWQEERREREGRRQHGSTVYVDFRRNGPVFEEPAREEDPSLRPLTDRQRAVLVLMAAAVCFTVCSILFPL